MSSVRYDTILISLDELFDTRLATLATVSPELAKHRLYNGWADRIMDHFPEFDMDDYRLRYEQRNEITLKLAKVTRVSLKLRDFAARVMVKSNTSPWDFKPRVCINTWPYQLSDDTINMIIRQVAHLTSEVMDVYAIHRSPEELTPEYVAENFSTVIMYDYRWLEIQRDNLKAFPIPQVSLLVPMVFQQYVELLPKEDPFAEISRIASPLINVVWIEPKILSIAINIQNVLE